MPSLPQPKLDGAGDSSASAVADAASRHDSSAFVFLALMTVFGSSTATAAKFAVAELPLPLIPLVRFAGAGLCLLPAVGGIAALRQLVREDGRRLLLAAAFCVPINQSFFLAGTRLAPTTHVALVYACCPLVVLVLATALGQERLITARVLGVIATVAGAILIALGHWIQPDTTARGVLRGDLLLVGAVTAWGAYITVNKPLVARHPALRVLAGTFLVGALLELPIALATLPTWPPLSSVSASGWRGLAYLTVVATLLVLACQNQALRRLDASQVAVAGNASPLLTILWGVWLLGESLTPTLVLGGTLILGGIAWTERPSRRDRAAEGTSG